MYNEVETGITMEYVFPRAQENRKPYLNKIFFIQGTTTPVSSVTPSDVHTNSYPVYTPTVVQGGWGLMEPLPRVFAMLH